MNECVNERINHSSPPPSNSNKFPFSASYVSNTWTTTMVGHQLCCPLLFFHIVCVSSPMAPTFDPLFDLLIKKMKNGLTYTLFQIFKISLWRWDCWVVVLQQVLWKAEKKCVRENPGLQCF
jgi:hypothetical protein